MKKILFALGMAVSSGIFAQDSTKMKKCFVMENGKVMATKNGSTVMMNGTVKMKDSTSTTLKERQYADMDGKMGMMSDTKMEKMKKDSL